VTIINNKVRIFSALKRLLLLLEESRPIVFSTARSAHTGDAKP
jgi:hypothetical protein